jgi:hypothetical protein
MKIRDLFKAVLAVSVLILFSGCFFASKPFDAARDGDHGKAYTQEEAQEIILESLKLMFKNYESAKIEFTELKKTFINYEIGERTIFGYGINAVVNSRNKEGVYTGDRTHLFFLKDDKVFYNYTRQDTRWKKAYWVEIRPDILE